MSDKGKDPMEVWHTFLGEMEKGFNSFANQAMGSQEFSRTMGQMTSASATASKAFSDAMEKYLTGMNLPSRSQMISFGERLQVIEGQLHEIKALLNRVHADVVAEQRGDAPKPPRTRQPPSATGGATGGGQS